MFGRSNVTCFTHFSPVPHAFTIHFLWIRCVHTRTSLATIGASMRAKIFRKRRGLWHLQNLQRSNSFKVKFLWFLPPTKKNVSSISSFGVRCLWWNLLATFFVTKGRDRRDTNLWIWWTPKRTDPQVQTQVFESIRQDEIKTPSMISQRFEMKTVAKVVWFVFIVFELWTVCNDFSELRFR